MPGQLHRLRPFEEIQSAPLAEKLAQALNSPAFKTFIETKYHGVVIPAF
jgi:ABC-type metal ion transport system substrate-binding protein